MSELRIEKVLNAPVSKVYDAWTQKEHFEAWAGPKGFKCTVKEMSVEADDGIHYMMANDRGYEMWLKSTYLEIVPNEKIVFIEAISDADGNLQKPPGAPDWPSHLHHVIEFQELHGATKMILTASGHETDEKEDVAFDMSKDRMKMGWDGAFEKLANHVEGSIQ